MRRDRRPGAVVQSGSKVGRCGIRGLSVRQIRRRQPSFGVPLSLENPPPSTGPTRQAACGAADEGELLDADHLSRQTMGDSALAAEVLALFTDQATATAETLRKGVAEADRRYLAHTLTGAARGVGAWRVARLASLLEAGGGQDVVGALIAAIEDTSALIGRRGAP